MANNTNTSSVRPRLSGAYHLTDAMLSYDRVLRANGRAKRAKIALGGARASAIEYARAERAGLCLVSPVMACTEYVETVGAWASTNDIVRLSYVWFNAYRDAGGKGK